MRISDWSSDVCSSDLNKVETLEILGDSDPEKFPLQPKKHSLEFLREIAHLRFRTNTFNAIFKVRTTLSFAIHQFFYDRGFVYLHTPIITGSVAERSEEHTSELQSLMRISYAVFCLKNTAPTQI